MFMVLKFSLFPVQSDVHFVFFVFPVHFLCLVELALGSEQFLLLNSFEIVDICDPSSLFQL